MTLTWISHSEQATEVAGAELAKLLHIGDVVLLTGDLGAGKTCFTRGIVSFLHGSSLAVKSPSYTILNIYEGKPEVRHFDFYRLENEQDMDELGLNDYWQGGIAIVEWAKDFCHSLPSRVIDVIITDMDNDVRKIEATLPEQII